MTHSTTPRPGTPPAPPVTPVRPSVRRIHGETLRDDYAWLKAENWREVLKDPAALPADIRAVLEAENAWCDAALAPLAPLRDALLKEMRGRIREDDAGVPAPHGPWLWYERYETGAGHELVCRRPRDGGPEQVLLDVEAMAKGKPFFEPGDVEHSPDFSRIAWSADEKGSELFAIRVREVDPDGTLRDLPDLVEDTTGEMAWQADSAGFFYVMNDENHRPRKVFLHRLGQPQEADRLVYFEQDPGWFVHLDVTQSGRYLIISCGDHETSEIWLVDLRDPEATPFLVAAREPQVRYSVDHHGDRLVICTNADGAEDFKLVKAPLAAPQRENWRDLVPHRPGVMILSHVAFAGHLARMERENARPRIVIRDFATGEEHAIAFDEETYALGMDGGYEYDVTELRFAYASLTTPASTYAYDMVTRARTLLKRQEVPSGHNPADYVATRLFATAPDGEQVPVSVLRRRDTPLDGSAPALVYGYGAYGHALSAGFRTSILSLVDRGFVYAIAHVRGGTEKGWAWYRNGKREHKPNTFTDFIAVCRALARAGYTSEGRIVAHGGSAGGMLMGAVANMAPELFAGIIADVPFVDVLNTMLDDSLPLTPPEWPEWGNPLASRADFELIRSYAPYEQVKPQRYPAILALGGLTDPRVTYWEPVKWVARLRAVMTGGGPILCRINMDAGHGGASGRFDSLKETALCYAFALQAARGFDAPPAG
ncbi:S9 family peptidase [Camelimonas abortus]|uniref:S9 family peptidase n=1 Tax=Camelimonas abortus TaxID=1017184 RepID=A0ABV7LBH4_9HYPH